MKKIKFKRYNSIENSYRKKTINTIIEQGKSVGKWSISEKIHGANFSFWYDGHDLKTANRSDFIGEGNFFNSHIVKEKYQKNVVSLFNYLKETIKDFQSIAVFGELFGGRYPHDDVKNDYGISAVQNGIWYNPKIDFYAFDIKINVTNGDKDDWKNNYFLNVDHANNLFEKFNFFYAKPIFEGTFKECLEFENMYITKIPPMFGLPEIENNTCEGNVLKPIEASYFWNGSRVVLKNKNKKFSEKKNKPKITKVINLSEEANDLMANALMYVNENRLRNVISKIGTIGQKDFGKVMGHLNKDTIEDFLKDYRERFISLDKKEAKIINKRIGQENANIVRDNFLYIIDGTY